VAVNQDYELAVQCHQAGMLDKAGKLCRKVLLKKPKHAQALHLLGLMAHQESNPAAAVEWHRKAVAAKPDFAQAHNSLGAALFACKRLDEAVESFRRAVATRPDYASALRNLGIALKDCGLVEESIDAQRRAFAAHLSWHEAHSGILLTRHCLSGHDPVSLLAGHRDWDRIHAGHLAGTIAPHANNRVADRRLRIGLVSPDFKEHPVIRFLMPFLEHHDRERIELFAYAQVAAPDEWTEQARKQVAHWRSLVNVPDAEAADLIRGDEIDILVDLAGHTKDNRLLVFARKPAPVQVTYLGYPGTTGLSAMDYRITDALADPPGMTEEHHSEQLIRLPGCAWNYCPDTDPLLGQDPAALRGCVTFGTFNNLSKINDRMLEVWARILEAVPGSRLLLKSVGFLSMKAQKRVRDVLLSKADISEERLDIRGPEDSHESHLALYREMDIALDTFPYHGTTTTCEALWMGVPVVTLAGQTHVSRVGVSLLTNVGLSELVAESEDEYVRIAVELAGNAERLSSYRANLRDQMRGSQLLDAPSFAREIEAAFRQMWISWVTSPDSACNGVQHDKWTGI
jgi:predicted O-linked N-acetylglucosamine transferase (SPINDLY family)